MQTDVFFFGADSAWSDLTDFGRRYQYMMRGFAEHNSVRHLYVVRRVTRKNLIRKLRARLSKPGNDKVVDVFIAPLLPERWWLPGTRKLNKVLARLQLSFQTSQEAGIFKLIWCYWRSGYQLADYLDIDGKRVFDADHNIVDDGNQSAESLRKNRATLLRCIDKDQLVVAGARSMLKWLEEHGHSRYAYLRNGIDVSRFEPVHPEPVAIRDLPHPRIGYVGALSTWINYDLVTKLARQRQDWHFIVLGTPYKTEESEAFKRLPNVHMLGSCAPRDVPAYLSAFDIGLGLYRTDPKWLDVDSMKLYEYLAAGLPVVTTPFHPHIRADFDHLVEVANNADEFEQTIEGLLERSAEEEKVWDENRHRFLEQNTWSTRCDQALNLATELAN